MPDIQMAPLPQHSSMGDTYLDSDGVVDAAGNRFSLLAEAQPGNGNVTFATLRKFAPDGTILGTWVFRPMPNQKIDKANLCRSGRDVIVECVTHAITSTKPRQLHKESGVVLGVFVTTSSFEAEEGGAGAFVGGETPPGESEPVDYDRINNMIRAALGLAAGSVSLKQEVTGSPTGNFRQAMEDKSKDALREERVMTEAMFAGGSGSHIVYQQLVNTSFTGAQGALTEAGFPPPDAPEDEPAE